MPARLGTTLRTAAVILIVLILVYFWARLTSNSPVEYAELKEHFKYGSTGGEVLTGIPYSVWMALPPIFGLPGGRYESFGFLYEPGKDLPIGVSKRRVQGIERVSFNCAICHVGSVRDTASGKPRYILGMPSNTVDLRAFYAFLFSAAGDERFSGALVLSQIDRMGIREDFINRLILQYYAVDAMRAALLDRNHRLAFILAEPEFGPGRIDTFSPAKALLNFRLDKMPDTEKIGTTDLPSVWNQGKREGMQLHWDGNNTSVQERNRSAAFGTGAYPATLDRASMRRIEAFLNDATPESYPYPVDRAKAERGKQVYDQLCAYCHGPDGTHFAPGQGALGKVTPIERIATDRRRLDSYTLELAVNQNLLYAGTAEPTERFSHFRKTYGYANMPLDGVWLRAPYLHNGSVPSLRDLLEPVAKRPAVFYRGDDVFDPVRVGFESNVAEREGRRFFRYDTATAGNGNRGHEGKEYGTELAPSDKDALVEYLKTF